MLSLEPCNENVQAQLLKSVAGCSEGESYSRQNRNDLGHSRMQITNL